MLIFAAISQEGPLPHPEVIVFYTVILAIFPMMVLLIAIGVIPSIFSEARTSLLCVLFFVGLAIIGTILTIPLSDVVNSDIALLLPVLATTTTIAVAAFGFFKEMCDQFDWTLPVSPEEMEEGIPIEEGSETDAIMKKG
jgi:hydrogenase/urease accessory protein HupE